VKATLALIIFAMATLTTRALPDDVRSLSYAAERLGIAASTAYRLAPLGKIPGAFKVGAQWRVSVIAFNRTVHGVEPEPVAS